MTVKQTLLMVIANLSDSECERFLEFLNTEKEIVVLDAQAPSDGVYSEVRNSECEADEPKVLEQTSGATLETRIDSENLCVCTSPNFHKEPRTGNIICLKCTNLHITHLNE